MDSTSLVLFLPILTFQSHRKLIVQISPFLISFPSLPRTSSNVLPIHKPAPTNPIPDSSSNESRSEISSTSATTIPTSNEPKWQLQFESIYASTSTFTISTSTTCFEQWHASTFLSFTWSSTTTTINGRRWNESRNGNAIFPTDSKPTSRWTCKQTFSFNVDA